MNFGKKNIGPRRTDHTDEHISERNPSKSGVFSATTYGKNQTNYGIG